ncbi:MAG: hypothetical protein GC149_02290 [Gammaproteobacteria bacterium]|nr:hypothetical protein [Gammaproteobacteria bacterium]
MMNKRRFIFNRLPETFIHVFLIFLGAVLVYSQVIGHDFVKYDDDIYLQSPIIANGISLYSIVHAFNVIVNDNWHPITVLSLMLDSQLYGIHSAYGFHITNMLLHILNGLLCYFFVRNISKSPEISIFVSLLFVAHPLQVETVSWVAERKGLLAALFFFSCLLFYIRFRNNNNRILYVASILCFILGLMAKAVIVMLPVILIIIEWLYLNSKKEDLKIRLNNAIKYLLPYFLVAFCMGVLTIYVQNESGVLSKSNVLPYTTRILNAILSTKIYIADNIS